MEEIISIHIGQSGIQVGNSCWELFCLEHQIQPDCKIIQNQKNEDLKTNFFSETQSGQFVPRSVYLDLDSNSIDEVKVGSQKQLFNHEFLVSKNDEKANTFARGNYQVSSEFIEFCLDKVRRLTESCQNLQGFLIYNSAGGGTGSGFGSLLTKKIKQNYNKKSVLGFTIYPSDKTQTNEFEPYNSVLYSQNLIENGDVNLVFDNEAIYDICNMNPYISNIAYTDLNRVIAQAVSQLTCGLRFDDEQQNHLSDFEKNLIPYPKFCFMLSSYSPFIFTQQINSIQLSTQEISSFLFEPSNMMAKCNPSFGKYMAVDITYRGAGIVPKHIGQSFNSWKEKKTLQFVNWCQSYIKLKAIYNIPCIVPQSSFAYSNKSVFMVSNSTSISEVFSRINNRFDQMFTKRQFTHLYQSEGMEEGELIQAREDLALLENDYQDAAETLEFQEEN
ncbi:tubulin/FtsZ family, GTPase domain protein (macronuclear) [Tetrahymena thermophila SB210]|uniref:Tubulin alpha chain n=1 Tax=Tetrahymena thermophila (strain SB210) TaxID=312017 RepID=Q22CD2_TETTS|nr:tubulin/FtsZ family, GTPase domain protein [Tetrahymena thermophila SB210]EAR82934.1 tubulin/FtsZ family, GTPase domain protein [Tetrahymena thermophila SB210]|eukprot:XP_001030597.1 tubulin/FtsZ family, GTPase domain protein [Tetrahymena thermophila SB210]